MRYYYYPLYSNDFNFENIFASESISPPSFYGERGFGIDYFYAIPNYHHKEALILFNAPPVFQIENPVNSDSIKFILQLSEASVDIDEAYVVGEGIIGYQKTVYLNRENFRILFFSERDKKLALLKSETSLPTKDLKKYQGN